MTQSSKESSGFSSTSCRVLSESFRAVLKLC